MSHIKDRSIGVIVYYKFPRSLKFLILKHKKGHWSFAKGHKDSGESDLMTAKRELKEEAGVEELKFMSKRSLLSESYLYTNKHDEKVKKTVDYFIAESNSKKIKIDKKEIVNYKWCTLSQGRKLITHKESKKILHDAVNLINKNNFNNQK